MMLAKVPHGEFRCTVCDFKSRTKNTVNTHFAKVHKGEKTEKEKIYKCEYCQKAFSIKKIMEDHTRLHTGEKPHKCPTCGQAFIAKTSLTGHIRKHHIVLVKQKSVKKVYTDVKKDQANTKTKSAVDINVAVSAWQERVAGESELFKPSLPLAQAMSNPRFLLLLLNILFRVLIFLILLLLILLLLLQVPGPRHQSQGSHRGQEVPSEHEEGG